MQRVKTFWRTFIGRAPMGAMEATVYVAAGAVGAVTFYTIHLAPEDPLWVWTLWWVGLITSLVLVTRGMIGLAALARHARDLPFWWLEKHLPFTVRSPIVWKPTPDRERSLGILDFEVEIRQSTARLLNALNRLYAEVGRGTEVLTRHGGRSGTSLDEMVRDASSFGRAYDRHARRLETAEARVRDYAARVVSSHLQRLDAYPAGADLSGVREMMATLRGTVTEARASVATNVSGLDKLRALNVHHTMNEAVDRVRAAMASILADYDEILAWTEDALAIIDKKKPRQRGTRKA